MGFALAAAIAAGIVSTILAGSNAALSKGLAQPMTAGFFILTVNAVGLLGWGLWRGGMSWPEAKAFSELPWWAWLGGLGGAAIMLAQLFLARELGAGAFLALTVTAGTVTSIAMDHYGWVGFDRQTAHWDRLLGGALMVAGVILIARNGGAWGGK